MELLYLIGGGLAFFSSVIAGDWGIIYIRKEMYAGMEDSASQAWRPRAIGWLERFLYSVSIIFGFPQFIAIWLALKVAGQWDRWKLDVRPNDVPETNRASPSNRARATYNVYLLGNGLSILYGALGAMVFNLVINELWMLVVAFNTSIFLLNIILYIYVRRQSRKLGENNSR